MKLFYLCVVAIFFSCQKEDTVEIAQNKLTVSSSFEVNGTSYSFNNFTIERLSGLYFSAITIPTASPLIRMESFALAELDSFHTSSQKINLKYYSGNKVYVADDKTGEGYILCLLNKNSESNVNIRDSSGNIRAALKREENFEARFNFKAINQAVPYDTINIRNGKLSRKGYYFVY